MFNKVIMMGRITHDPELKVTPNGTNACSFRIAVDRNYQVKGEEKKTDFFNVVAWRANAEFVTRYFSKGRMILIEGEMQTRQYTDKNGNPATWYEINADRVSFTGEKKADTQSDSVPAAAPPAYSAAQTPPNNYAAGEVGASADDDYPF